jgi:anion-transporting  ArsA/GET3 family ATPase
LGWVAAKGAEYALGTAVVFLLTTPLDMLLGRITLRRLEMRVGDGENAVQKVRLRINYRQGKDLQDRLHPYEAAEKRLREIKKRLRDHRNELTESKQLVLVKGGRENIVEQYNAEIARVQNQMMRVSELFATVRGEHCRAAGLVDLTALLRRVPDMPTLDDSPSEEAIGGDIELLRVHMGEIQAIRQDAEACTQKWSRGGFVRPGSGQSPPIQEQEAHNAQRIDSVTRRLRAREDHLDRMADQLEVHRLRLANPATDLGALRQDLSVIVENLRDQSPPSDAAGQIDSPMPAPSSLGLMAADLRDELEDLGSDLNAHLAAIQEVESLGES